MLTHRYALPLLSGVLLALVFFPFYFWPLAFVALAPLFYFASGERSNRELIIAGMIVGVVGLGPLAYLSLAQLALFPDSVGFTYLIRASSVPLVTLAGALFGVLALLYHKFYTTSLPVAPLVGGALYVLVVEMLFFWIFDGYYYGALSHAAVSLPGVMALASLGGAVGVSLFIAVVNASLAEVVKFKERGTSAAVPLAAVLLLWAGVALYSREIETDKGLSVAVIQGAFEEFATTTADLLIYPSSLVQGPVSVSADALAGEHLAQLTSPATTVLVWQTLEENGEMFDEYALWRSGEKSSYRKQKLYALSDDYTPSWLSALGIEKSSYGITAGSPNNRALVEGSPVGSLICSELHQVEFARRAVADTPFVVAVGSDAMFPGSLSGNFSLAAARLRAAENGVPVVRGNLEGPSAIINADGSIQAELAYGEVGVVRGQVSLEGGSNTPYAKTGSWPVFVLSLMIVGAATLRRFGH